VAFRSWLILSVLRGKNMISKFFSLLFGIFLTLLCISIIIVPLATKFLSRADTTVLFSDDFETGNLSKWNDRNGNPTVSTTYKHSGNYACRGQYSFYEPVYVFHQAKTRYTWRSGITTLGYRMQ